MTSIDEERNAAAEAEHAIRTLSPSTRSLNTEAIVKVLRGAYLITTRARAAPSFSSEAPLNSARDEIGIAFPGLIRELENGSLTQATIDRAKRAVEEWKAQFAVR